MRAFITGPLGIGAMLTQSPLEQVFNPTSPAIQKVIAQGTFAQPTQREAISNAITNTPPPEKMAAAIPNVPPECECLVEKARVFAESTGVPVGPNEQAQMLRDCATDSKGYTSFLESARIDVESCKPWYLQRRNIYLMAGGAGVALLGFFALRK